MYMLCTIYITQSGSDLNITPKTVILLLFHKGENLCDLGFFTDFLNV